MADQSDVPSGLASNAVAVTPSDSTVVAYSGLYVGTTGDVAIKGRSPVAVTLVGVPAGTILPINVTRVMSTNTTALNIVGFTP